ncbi:alpha/beta hydrolase [Pseudomaricurvus sp. HS19]|uniref:alpha/beta hydrolase n=1 Tax=Pseudomaricurvus sp. HS19 TaxID=2692626 RepID=UPI00136C489C|nr:alpha/beta hydrolase [Pseudomaricurvus sp. HS19]MYM65063.1 alpha/beta hydrolase [Pseudomaricurvus sp. HS19]
MAQYTLYFATNRGHEGKDRWHPSGYGPGFSSDGYDNLRFGKLTIKADTDDVKKLLAQTEEKDPRRTGNGEKLAGLLGKAAEKAAITAFPDSVTQANPDNKKVTEQKNASADMFREIKAIMEETNDVLVYIHGFNVSWSEAVGSALALELMLNRPSQMPANPVPDKQKSVKVILFSWPSDGKMIPWRSYTSDRKDARRSGEAVGRAILKLRDFLIQLRVDARKQEQRLCKQSMHLLCHSMGNYVLQNSLDKLLEHLTSNHLPRLFENIFMCAADVDDNVFENGKPMVRLPEICRNVYIYSNRGDTALKISDATKGNPDRLGHDGPSRPQALHHKINQIDCSNIVTGFVEHSYYLWATVNEDIDQTLHCIAEDDQSLRRRRRKADGLNVWKLT